MPRFEHDSTGESLCRAESRRLDEQSCRAISCCAWYGATSRITSSPAAQSSFSSTITSQPECWSRIGSRSAVGSCIDVPKMLGFLQLGVNWTKDSAAWCWTPTAKSGDRLFAARLFPVSAVCACTPWARIEPAWMAYAACLSRERYHGDGLPVASLATVLIDECATRVPAYQSQLCGSSFMRTPTPSVADFVTAPPSPAPTALPRKAETSAPLHVAATSVPIDPASPYAQRIQLAIAAPRWDSVLVWLRWICLSIYFWT